MNQQNEFAINMKPEEMAGDSRRRVNSGSEMEFYPGSEHVITQKTDEQIKVMAIDMRQFTLSSFFTLVKNSAICVGNDKTARQLFKKAIKNYYAQFKLFNRSYGRTFVTNPLFIYEICISGILVVDIVTSINYYLKLGGFPLLDEKEQILAMDNYLLISNSLVHGMVERDYAYWLRTLFEKFDSSHAFMDSSFFMEKQMFSTNVVVPDDVLDDVNSLKEAIASLPDQQERNKWLDTMKGMAERVDNSTPSGEQWNDLTDSAKKMSSAFTKISEAIPELKTNTSYLSVLSSQFAKFEANAKATVEGMNGFASKAKDIAVCSLVAWATLRYAEDKSKSNLALVAIAGAAGFYFSSSHEAKIFIMSSGAVALYQLVVSDEKPGDEEIQRQAGGLSDISEILKSITTFFTSIKWGALPRKILDVIRVCKELPAFLMQVFQLLKGFANTVWMMYFKTPLFSVNGELAPTYVSELEYYCTAYANDNLKHTFEEAEAVDKLIQQTTTYLNSCKEFGDRKLLDSYFKMLIKIKEDLQDQRHTKGGARPEPVTILEEGEPDSKKTVMGRQKAIAIVKAVKPGIKDPERQIFAKPAGDYWSGYDNQVVTFNDDFGQVRDSLGDPREKGDLINMYNTTPFPLDMNENEDKGKYFFTSAFVIMTANEGWDMCPSLISQAALHRRIDLRFKIVKIAEDEVDKGGSGVEFMDPKNYIFIRYDKKNNVMGKYTFQQALDEALIMYRRKQTYFRVFQCIQNEVIGDATISDEAAAYADDLFKEVDSKLDAMMEANSILFKKDVDETVTKQGGSVTDAQKRLAREKREQKKRNKKEEKIQIMKALDEILSEKEEVQAQLAALDKEIPKVKLPLMPRRIGEKIYDNYRFKCEYYDDTQGLEYEAALELIKKFTGDEDLPRGIVPDQDVKFLELHYGVNRTNLFLREFRYALRRFGRVKVDPIAKLVANTSREMRGYYRTEASIMMAIWLHDRKSFYKCCIDDTLVLQEMVEMQGFKDITLMSDWNLAFKRASIKFTEMFQLGLDKLKAVVSRIEESIADKITEVLNITSFSRDDVIKFVSFSATALAIFTVVTPILGSIAAWLTGSKKVDSQSSQHFYKDTKPTTKVSIKDMLRDRQSVKQGSSMLPAINKIERSAADVIVWTPAKEQVLGKVFFLDTNTFLMPLHFVPDFVHLKDCKMIIDDGETKVTLDPDDFLNTQSSVETEVLEFVICRSDKLKKTRKNTIENFATRDQISKFPAEFQIAIKPYTENATVIGSASIGKFKYANYTVDKMIKYAVNTGKGDCGSMIYAMLPNLGSSLICGIHDAGTPKGSYVNMAAAYIISREDILEALAAFEDDSLGEVEVQGNSASIYPHSHSPYGYSKIVKSPIWEEVNRQTSYPNKAPAKLLPSKDGTMDPLEIAMRNYKLYDKSIDEVAMHKAKNDLLDHLTGFVHHVQYGSRVPTDIAFFGDPEITHQKAIPTSTSPGYPYKFTDKDIKKRMKEGGPNCPDFVSFKVHIENLIEQMRNGHRPLFLYTLNLKDEIRYYQKVLDFKTRAFMGCGLDLVELSKEYYGEFILFMNMNCIEKGTAMTVNPHSKDWKEIMNRLSKFSPDYGSTVSNDFDFAHFDGSNCPDIIKILVWIVCKWYEHHGIEVDNDMRELLAKEVYNFRYINGSQIVEMESSLPSGSLLTLLFNCLTNMLLIRYSYYRKFPDGKYSEDVVEIVLGDDNAVSIREELKYVWTPMDIASAVAECGFEITLGSKESVTSEWSTLFDITFLKRKFTYDKYGVVRAPLDVDTMWNTICYSKSGILYRQIFADSIAFFYREFSQHGQLVFKTQVKVLRDILKENPLVNCYPTNLPRDWHTLDHLVRNSPFFSVDHAF